jgi:anti-anti-sigma factor
MLKPSLETRNLDGILVAEFWECFRLDFAPVQELRTRFESHVKSGGRPQVVVDLSGVGFAGSAALGNFVALQRAARQNGGRIVFCNVDPTVSEVFRASKLDSLFEFAADRPAALDAIQDRSVGGEPKDRKPPDGEPARRDKPQAPSRGGPGPLKRSRRNPGSSS